MDTIEPLKPAIEMRELGRHEEAEKWLINRLEGNPVDPEALCLLSQVLMLNNKLPEATSALSRASKIAPNSPSVSRNRARSLLLQSNPEAALDCALGAYSSDPTNTESRLVLAGCFRVNGRDDEALSLLDEILGATPDHAEALINRALIYLKSEEIAKAIDDAKRASIYKPHLANAWALLGTLYQKAGNRLEAMAAYRKAHKVDPRNVNVLLNLSELLRIDNNVKESISILQTATQLNPDDDRLWINYGVSLQHASRLREAKEAYHKALDINPNSPVVHSNLGAMSIDAKDWKSADAYLRKAITMKPDLPEAHDGLGQSLAARRLYGEALHSFNCAIRLKPDFDRAYNNRGNVFNAIGKLREAKEDYSKAISLKSNNAAAHNNLGTVSKKLGDLTSALDCYNTAIALDPNYAEAFNNIGTILKSQESFEEAKLNIKKSLSIDPNYAEAQFNLGEILLSESKYEESLRCFTKARDLNSDLTEASNRILQTLFLIDDKDRLFSELDSLSKANKTNAVIGSITCRASLKYGMKQENSFCSEPLKYVLHIDLSCHCDFENVFIKQSIDILNEGKITSRNQPLLEKSVQTSGNIFEIEEHRMQLIEAILHDQLNRYRERYRNRGIGLIDRWPVEYNIRGWLIKMKSGGNIKPHIHDNGWLSGSVYINIPSRTNDDSGSLVVSLGNEHDLRAENTLPKDTIKVETGSLVLFPASLTHHTIPFSSPEDRIVLAFDVVPQ